MCFVKDHANHNFPNNYDQLWFFNWCDSFLPVDQSERFTEASKNGNLIPLYRTIFSDHLTPVLAYRCLVKEDDRDAPSFLFESVEPGLRASSIVSILFKLIHVFQVFLSTGLQCFEL